MDKDESAATRPTPHKRGRKPLGERAMTGAERMRQVRARLHADGGKTFAITVRGRRLEVVEQLAQATGEPLGRTLQNIVDLGFTQAMMAAELTISGMVAGIPADEIQQLIVDAEAPLREKLKQWREGIHINKGKEEARSPASE